MKFLVKNTSIEKAQTDCLIVGIFEGKTPNSFIAELDKLTDGAIANLIKTGDIATKLGETTFLYQLPNLKVKKVLFVGCGKASDFNFTGYTTAITQVISQLKTKNITKAICCLAELPVKKVSTYDIARQTVDCFYQAFYSFNQFKTKSKKTEHSFAELTIIIYEKKAQVDAKLGISHGVAIGLAMNSTKDLANLPPNICNASYLAEQAKTLAKTYSEIKTTILGEKELKKLNMNAYLAVGQGSANESIMSIMEYSGAKDKKEKPIVFVGKGLTFDSGGISIKPSAGMDEMKYDMCGAASVYGVMQAIAELQLPINVIGIMAGCENMPSSKAYRPGDILTTMSGLTVEVNNTDAEGRLVLCDVLTYVERYQPKAVIDIATLTGACIVALGHHYTGLIVNNESLAKQLLTASEQARDKAWRLPLDSDFQQQIESPFADIVNSAGRDGGTITAGCFLSRFTEKYDWAHLDIAGTAWKSGAHKGATGRPVAMLVQYLLNTTEK